jgi:thiamine-phosphate pyrophosphorylase
LSSRPAPRLYLITDRHATAGRPLADVVAAALRGVADSRLPADEVAVQLREKSLSGRELTELARRLRAITAAAGVALYVNDRIDVALTVGADGVHLGGTSLDAATVAAVAPEMAIAVSVHSAAEVAALRGPLTLTLSPLRGARGPDRIAFALLGPIGDTPSKRPYGPPLGDAAVTEAASSGLPIVAVGGVGPENVRALRAAGAHGVACIRAVMAAPDPAAAVGALCQELKKFRKMDSL